MIRAGRERHGDPNDSTFGIRSIGGNGYEAARHPNVVSRSIVELPVGRIRKRRGDRAGLERGIRRKFPVGWSRVWNQLVLLQVILFPNNIHKHLVLEGPNNGRSVDIPKKRIPRFGGMVDSRQGWISNLKRVQGR